MNLSERIRSLISEPLTAAEIHKKCEIEVDLVRGLLQTMVKLGIAKRIGDKRPYQYQLARPLKQQNRGFKLNDKKNISQEIRDQLKVKNMAPAEIGAALGITTEKAYQHMRDMLPGGYICKMGDGKYMWLKDPKQPLTPDQKAAKAEAKREKRKANRRIAAALSPKRIRHPRMTPLTVKKSANPQCDKPAQTVDEWLKAGGVIDRSPTLPKFERLTAKDIAKGIYRQRSIVTVNAGRSYLTA